MLGGYEFLIRLAVFAFYPLLVVTYVGAAVLRRRHGIPTGFWMPLYPLPIVFYVGVMGLVMVASLLDDPLAVVYSVSVTALGYLAWSFARATVPSGR